MCDSAPSSTLEYNRRVTDLVTAIAAELDTSVGLRRVIAAVDDARALAAWAHGDRPDIEEIERIARVLLTAERPPQPRRPL